MEKEEALGLLNNMQLVNLATIDGDQLRVRATGNLEIIENMAVKAELAEQMPFFSMFWKTPEDPGYTLMRLDLKRIQVLFPYKNEMAAFDL
jgi:uncharacterized pyridoxamine 5'-phosphate oxidase family protein